MKTFCLILITAITMKTCSQNTVTPPTPPTPPDVSSSSTVTGITHAKSETENAYAFSCTFNLNLKNDIVKIISKEFNKYTNEFIDKKFTKEKENEYYYKIELKSTELKLEYKFDSPNDKDRIKITNKFNNIESAILGL